MELLRRGEDGHPDLVLNCLFVLALKNFKAICAHTNTDYPYGEKAEELSAKIRETFYTDKKLFTMNVGKEEYTALGNSLAVLAEIVTGKDAEALCDRIFSGELVESSLSMKILTYQALMNTDTDKYREFILSEIRKNYTKMLDAGSTTVWETIDGSSAFRNAGSLCHGWSAVPIWIYWNCL